MEPVRVGIVGCGVIGVRAHLPAATKSPLAEVVAVADLIAERADEAARKFGVANVYYGDEDLLSDERIDAVILAMPTADRTPVAYKALKRGKHVLLEKPIAGAASEVEEMIALRGDRVVGCCSPRFALQPSGLAAAKCVADGALGELRVVRARAVLPAPPEPNKSPPPWRQSMSRNGGGILVNWGCYDLDCLMSVTGWRLRPRSVMAQWWPVDESLAANVAPGSDADSHYTVLIRCDGGAVIALERAEFSTAVSDQAWEIVGSRASMRIPMCRQEGKPTAVMLDRVVPGEGIVSQVVWEEGAEGGPERIDVDEDFFAAILEGRAPATGLERALLMQKITDAVYESARTGRSVDID